MDTTKASEFSYHLERWRAGDHDAGVEVLALAYDDMRRAARNLMRNERIGHTLQPTAVANEAFIRLLKSDPTMWHDSRHFFAIATRQMRHILIDHARQRPVDNRRFGHVELRESHAEVPPSFEQSVAFYEALGALEEIHPRACRAFEYRYFMGLSEKEAACLLGVSLATFKRDWTFAKAWLARSLELDEKSDK